MASKNDDGFPFDKLRAGCQLTNRDLNFIAFCNELKAYVEEHHLFPPKHTNLLSKIKYTRKKIKDGSLEDEKAKELESVLGLRDLSLHTGGRRKSDNTENK